MSKPRLLFVVTEDWYFCSHRLPLALAARAAGFDVTLAARTGTHADALRAAGIAVVPWRIVRGSTGALAEARALYGLWKIFRAVRPDLVHQVALKPVLYGSLVARWVRPRAVVSALGGMGSLFASEGSSQGERRDRPKAWLKAALLRCLGSLLSAAGHVLILQNDDDARLVVEQAGLARARLRMVRGAGVNVEQFSVQPEPESLPLVILPARMLWDKGVGEFVEAARLVNAGGVKACFALVGGIDEANPSAIGREQLARWTDSGLVQWFGARSDMPQVYASANIVCLPSYREGLPKALLEAAASARAIVTTDVPGCRDVVRDGVNGLLVPARDAVALAAACSVLLAAPALRSRMGMAGRAMAVEEFSEDRVIAETLAIYADLLEKEPQ